MIRRKWIAYQFSLLLGILVEAAERVFETSGKLPQRLWRWLPGHDGEWRRMDDGERGIANRGERRKCAKAKERGGVCLHRRSSAAPTTAGQQALSLFPSFLDLEDVEGCQLAKGREQQASERASGGGRYWAAVISGLNLKRWDCAPQQQGHGRGATLFLSYRLSQSVSQSSDLDPDQTNPDPEVGYRYRPAAASAKPETVSLVNRFGCQ